MKKVHFYLVIVFFLVLPIHQFAAEAEQPKNMVKSLVSTALPTVIKKLSLEELQKKLNHDLFAEALKAYPSLNIQEIPRKQEALKPYHSKQPLPFITNDRYLIQISTIDNTYYCQLYIYDRASKTETKKAVRWDGTGTVLSLGFISDNPENRISGSTFGENQLYFLIKKENAKMISIIYIDQPEDIIDLNGNNSVVQPDPGNNIESINILKAQPQILVQLATNIHPNPSGFRDPENLIISIDLGKKRAALVKQDLSIIPNAQFFYRGSDSFLATEKEFNLPGSLRACKAFIRSDKVVYTPVKDIAHLSYQHPIGLQVFDILNFHDYHVFVLGRKNPREIREVDGSLDDPTFLVFVDPLLSKQATILHFSKRHHVRPVYAYDPSVGIALMSDVYNRAGPVGHFIEASLNIIDTNKKVHTFPMAEKIDDVKMFHYADQDILVLHTFDGNVNFYRYQNEKLDLLHTISNVRAIKKVNKQLAIITQSSIETSNPLNFILQKLDVSNEANWQTFIDYDKQIRPTLLVPCKKVQLGGHQPITKDLPPELSYPPIGDKEIVRPVLPPFVVTRPVGGFLPPPPPLQRMVEAVAAQPALPPSKKLEMAPPE